MSAEVQRYGNSERDRFVEDIASVLSRGYTLLGSDVEQLLPAYGYSYGVQPFDVLGPNPNNVRDFALQGVKLASVRHKARIIYKDGNLKASETDISDSRQRINTRLAEVSRIKKATTIRNRESTRYYRNPYKYAQELAKEATADGVQLVGW